jgi:hypothetical protein
MKKPVRLLPRTGALLAGGLGIVILGLAAPIAWTEATCRGSAVPQTAPQHLTAEKDQRLEARTYLTYPEWHVVYAYEELGKVLATGDPHDFAYWPAIKGFWSTLCAVSEEADSLGEAGFDAKATIYTVGASFTLEMLAKAAYEETKGRLTLLLSPAEDGAAEPSHQDEVETRMAQTYGAFLHQTPWYRFDFDAWTGRLWEAPIGPALRSWERRIAVGLEWKAKAAYAGLIENAAGAMGADETEMKVHVTDLTSAQIAELGEGVLQVEDNQDRGAILTVSRYRAFTRTAEAIAAAGGNFTEIAGNDDILVTLLAANDPDLPESARLLRRVERQSAEERRHLVAVKVGDLADLIRGLETSGATLEHVYDY